MPVGLLVQKGLNAEGVGNGGRHRRPTPSLCLAQTFPMTLLTSTLTTRLLGNLPITRI